MDSVYGDCWRCQKPAQGVRCEKCLIAEYCNTECRQRDHLFHEPLCVSALSESTCSFCKSRKSELKRCCGCYSAIYCDGVCQKKHWKFHKTSCKILQNEITVQSLGMMGSEYKDLPWLIGTTAAEDYLNLSKNEGSSYSSTLRLLFVGVGDIKDVVKTITDVPNNFSGNIDFVLNDYSPHIMARNILFLYCILVKEEIDDIIQIWYSLLLSPQCLKFLKTTLQSLIKGKKEILTSSTNIEISDSNWEACKDVWNGWFQTASEPNLCQKIVDLRHKKFACDHNSIDGLKFLYASTPDFHENSLKAFYANGLFLPLNSQRRKKAVHGNPTMACFNPMKDEYNQKYPDINKDAAFINKWVKVLPTDDDMIYAIRTDASVFRNWDYLVVKKNVGLKPDVIEMYVAYLKKLYKVFSSSLKQRNFSMRLIVDDFQDLDEYLLPDEKFDRIFTSNLCDYFLTPVLLEKFSHRLNRLNQHSVLICRQENWTGFTRMYEKLSKNDILNEALVLMAKDMKERNEVLPGMADLARLHCLKTQPGVCEDYFDTHPFLFSKLLSEILLYRHVNDGLPLEKVSFQKPSEMAKRFGMKFRDFRLKLNHVVPFQREANIRRVSTMLNQYRYIEWYISP